jgi:hypothetical protein
VAITKIESASVQVLELPTGQAHFHLLANLDNSTYEILEQHAQDGLPTTDRTSSTSPNPLDVRRSVVMPSQRHKDALQRRCRIHQCVRYPEHRDSPGREHDGTGPALIMGGGHLSKHLGLMCLLGLLAFVAVSWAPAISVARDEPRISYSEMRTSGRPAGLYESGFSADDDICQGALRFLNQPAPMPLGLRMRQDYVKVDTAFFLGTRANVAWEPRWLISVIRSKAGRPGVLDETAADIFNTGQPLRVYRFEGSVGGGRFHSIYAAPADSFSPHLIERGDRIDGLRVARVMGLLADLKPFELDFHFDLAMEAIGLAKPPWAGVFADILQLEGKTYFLVTSAIKKYRHNRTYLLRFTSHRDRKLLCEFRSDYMFVDE